VASMAPLPWPRARSRARSNRGRSAAIRSARQQHSPSQLAAPSPRVQVSACVWISLLLPPQAPARNGRVPE
jgi:hypothetical protein